MEFSKEEFSEVDLHVAVEESFNQVSVIETNRLLPTSKKKWKRSRWNSSNMLTPVEIMKA